MSKGDAIPSSLGGPRAVADLQQLVEKYIEESRRYRNRVTALEVELMALKGPCSNSACRLWYAHMGPCAERPRNVYCANCGDTRGGPVGHETSECRFIR